MSSVGFIILRYVNSEKTNLYWQECYDCIRKFYPENTIIIIDDSSNTDYLTKKELTNTHVIYAPLEYKGRGEILPYYYFLNFKLFDTAVILHDSVFLNEYIHFQVDEYKSIWDFRHDWDNETGETEMLETLDNSHELIEFYKKKDLWRGCFGGTTIINHDYLKQVEEKYKITSLVNVVKSRYDRHNLERVIGCVLKMNSTKYSTGNVLFGDIHNYILYGGYHFLYSFDEYINDKVNNNLRLPLLKTFTGR